MSELPGENARLAERAARIQSLLRKRREERAADKGEEGIPRRAQGSPAPLSFAQERLWFLDRLDPGNPTYNIPMALRLRGRLLPGILAACLDEAVRRHEALRTTFLMADAVAVQIVAPALGLPMPRVDLHGLGELAPDEARRLARVEARLPFDLARGPLVRAALLALGDEEHVLLLTLHHAIADGWSLRILTRELAQLYEAFSDSRPSPLPELPIQYGDFAAWQREYLQGPVLAGQVAWWRGALGSAPVVLDLPLDHPRGPVPSSRGGSHPFALPFEVQERLQAAVREQGVTLFMPLLLAFQALLGRWSRQEDLLVGTPIANRNRVETEDLIGFFANTLVLRGDLRGSLTFREGLARVREICLGAFTHQDLPFERLVAELNPERDLGRSPLFQAMFALQNLGPAAPRTGRLAIEPMEVPAGVAKFDLSLSVFEGKRGLFGTLEYRRDLFEPATVARFAAQWKALVAGALADPGAPLLELPLLGPAERHQLVREWNDTATDYSSAACLHELIAEQAARTPDAPALSFEGESLTYAELDRRANHLAWRLRDLGVGPEVRVAVEVERSLELPLALLAVLKAGGAYVPLDPSYPRERLDYMLEDSRAAVRLSREQVVSGDSGESAEAPDSGVQPDNLAYVIYTSGSTGRPKGAMNSHRGIVNRLRWMQSAYGLDGSDRVLQKTPASFDVSVWEFFWPLLTGACLVVAKPGGHQDGAYLVDLIQREKVTTLHFVPSMLQVFVEQRGVEQCASLRRVICSGEALPADLVRRFFERSGAELHNLYGPTEAAVDVTFQPCRREDRSVPIGRPIANLSIHVVDSSFHPAPLGVPGELLIGGVGVGRGYLDRPDLTAERFVPGEGERLYRTGDLARHLGDGRIEFLGRIDHQVKVRGFRIELQEVEAALAAHPAVREALVVPWEQTLAAYVVPRGEVDPADLREALRRSLPDFMVPASFTLLPAFPLNPSGKADRRALPKPERSKAGGAHPRSETERALAAIWCDVLSLPEVPVTESFFDLGGHSLLLARVERRIREEMGREVPLLELFRHPTVETLAAFLTDGQPLARAAAPAPAASGSTVAIVGMAGRFPGAGSVEELWRRLRRGDELVTFLSDEELLAAGVPRETLADPRYVRARGVLDGSDRFAASFFEVSPREAEIMDPQQRVFLECAWEALEDAGIDPARFPGRVAVFAGASENSYVRNLQARPEVVRAVGAYHASLLNRPDYLPTRVSYKLDLKGPSLNVQTACSTSLVAVHLACRSLLEGECEAALAGGVSVAGFRRGYVHEEGGISSPDGHTRTFSARARGTVSAEGAGIVVLKRLEDALESGDRIYAVLRATALNNDGANKIGFTAPSIDGQAAVIAAAQAAAGVDPETLGYVEAHGTATELGDPIEMAALTQAFRARTARTGYCAIGSIKSNFGHLDAAAGVAGLIKTALAVERGEIPPSLHFDEPNPRIDFASSPFYVQTALTPWPERDGPRRAAVSSFGIGGTNAHAILEQAPAGPETGPSRCWHLLPLSAKTPVALDAACARLADHLERYPDLDLADVAWTLQVGRRAFAHRRIVVAGGREEAITQLRETGITGVAGRAGRPVFFLFPGQGSQHAGMAMELYREEPVFREHLDRCLELLGPEILAALETGEGLLDTSIAQPALFAVEYSLARLWMSWGIAPAGFLGHSIGEYVAACLAGVFTLEQALSIVVARGRLMQQLPEGAMLAYSGPEEAATSRGLAIAAVNAPGALVVSGPVAAIEELERELPESHRLFTRRAFHSAMTEPVLEPFARQVGEHALAAPAMPFVSNLSGTWITGAEVTDPGYWARHLRGTVRFGDGIRTLLEEPDAVLLEVGPRRTLAALARRQAEGVPGSVVLSSLATPGEPVREEQALLSALGRLWISGIEVDWAGVNAIGRRRRVPLPTYPFERGSFWVAAPNAAAPPKSVVPAPAVSASPGSETERRIAGIWRELLGVARIEPHDNFFELGGSSLLAVRLGSHLRRELGVEIAPHLLLAHPTLGSFASAVTALTPGAPEPASGCLVAVQPRGGRPPLFLVHPAGGHVYLFRELAEELGEDQPLYGLRALGLEPGETPAASVEEMAERYLTEIRAFRPAGPYLLGGSSMGGMIAYEMAQRLVASGERVPLLALFDTFGPGQLPDRAGDGELARREMDRPRPLADVDPDARQRLVSVVRANVDAMYAYEPRPYPGKLVFFRADDRGADPPHPERPWIELARGGTEIYPVPGDHVSLHARPHVAVVAGRLARCLEVALRR